MLYKPFDSLEFNDSTCFLTGRKDVEKITVFPQWILDDFDLKDKPFKLLDESIITYSGITVPTSKTIRPAINAIDKEVHAAFTQGFSAVNALSEEKLFQWIAKLVYGILHFEVRAGIRQQARAGERMAFSHSLIHRFSNFHFMLQSLTYPTVFDGPAPWSLQVLEVKNAPAAFSYRDEINTLTFSMRMNDFGIIACLQDNGCNKRYHQEVIQKISGQSLHPVQFEELCGRFFYSSYLFNRLPEYTILETGDTNYIEPMTLRGLETKPLFDVWQNKVYGQVLENFWKSWGFLLLEIIKDPERPMSFLLNEEDEFIAPEHIALSPA